jgi:hypothetical protein
MPTIKVSDKTKDKLNELIAKELELKIKECKGDKGLYVKIIKDRYGMSYDAFINKLITKYTK